MKKSQLSSKIITRRSLILGTVKLSAMSLLVSRLYYLQFIKHDQYEMQAEDNRIRSRILPPSRGLILDRNGNALAKNIRFYRLLLEKMKGGVKEGSPNYTNLRKISKLLNFPQKRVEQLTTELEKTPLGRSINIKNYMSWDEISLLSFHLSSIAGMSIEEREFRHYPLGEAIAHMVGYVGLVSKEDMKPDKPVLKLPEFRIGKLGVEKAKEDILQGKAGVEYVEVNAKGIALRVLNKRDSVAGLPVELTIDSRLQKFAAERLGDESGSVVVMDVQTGEIVAMTSMPAYNPNIFSKGISHDYWNKLHNNPKIPLMNKAITGQYPPGSTFKMIVGMAALESGIATEKTTVHCPGYFMLGKHRFNCWKEHGHGSVDISKAITESCDTYFYNIADKLGIEKIVDMAKRFGLGSEFDIGIIGEKTGLLPTKEWKLKRHGEKWQRGDTINSAIGQGYVLATPLQLAVMTARMANNGRVVTPHIYKEHDKTTINTDKNLIKVNQEHLKIIQKAMYDVVNQPNGTAYRSRIIDKEMPELIMAGKTGTSQVKKITKRGVDQDSIPWKERHHALFVGYAPFENPKYAISVIVEHGGGGSKAAAPVARDVLHQAFTLLS